MRANNERDTRVLAECALVNRQYQMETFLHEHAAHFRELVQFAHEPSDGDPVCTARNLFIFIVICHSLC